jgi:pimeloyl-ACP methyl ester carboxylesterase
MLTLDIDVTAAAGLDEQAHTRVTVALPHPSKLPATPVVCFALPGGGYSRGYFTFDMPGSSGGGQAGWHAQRGWIFVAIDHLGTGESSLPDATKLVYKNVAASNHATATAVLELLATGALAAGFPAITNPVVLGIGHSMGGCLTVVQQARHNTYDGIAVLGFSAIHTRPHDLPGTPRSRVAYIPRDTFPTAPDFNSPENRRAQAVNSALLELGNAATIYPASRPSAWRYHYDDEPAEIVEQDMNPQGGLPVWRSATVPGLILWVTAPGAIAPEAAAIVVPVLSAFGERDVLEDPRSEPKAYRNAVDICTFICPRMAHMHNFAGTREVLWSRIETWGDHVVDLKRRLPQSWPSRLFSDTY